MWDWYWKRIGAEDMRTLDTRIAETFVAGRIAYQHCPACGATQTFARDFCVACLRPAPDWREAAGTGRVVACTVMHRAPTPEWKAHLPYAIALVDLAEGPRVMALADGVLRAGDAVRLCDHPVHNLPYFEAAETS